MENNNINNNNIPSVTTNNNENIKKQYNLIEKEYYLNYETHRYYSNFYYYMNILNIIFICSSTITNFVNQLYRENIYVSITVNSILFITSVNTGILHFLQYEKLSEIHLTKANAYKSLLLSIKRNQINLDNDETMTDKKQRDFLKWIIEKYDQLLLSGPSIPDYVKNKSKLGFKPDKLLGPDYEMTEVKIQNDSSNESASKEDIYQIERWLNLQ